MERQTGSGGARGRIPAGLHTILSGHGEFNKNPTPRRHFQSTSRQRCHEACLCPGWVEFGRPANLNNSRARNDPLTEATTYGTLLGLAFSGPRSRAGPSGESAQPPKGNGLLL